MHMADRIRSSFGSDRCISTASTVSGIYYRTLLPSPPPVCMFYFAHPFGGIATPSSTSHSIDPYYGAPTKNAAVAVPTQKPLIGWCNRMHSNDNNNQQHVTEYVPWPQETWQRDGDMMQPVILALQQQLGQNIADFEAVLSAIRETWYPPCKDQSQYLHNCYSFIQREKQLLSERYFDNFSNLPVHKDKSKIKYQMMDSKSFMESKVNSSSSIVGQNRNKPHMGLLRRRHSLPEIIMRKHKLATQKHTFNGLLEPRVPAVTAPTPPTRERIPLSFQYTSRLRTNTTSTSSSASSSSIIASSNTGSDSNLSRTYPSQGSMRRQLLQRLWSKENRRLERTGSLSPPLQRSQRIRRGLQQQRIDNSSPEVCLKCQKLEECYFNRSVPEITTKRVKYSTSSLSITNGSFKRKSYLMDAGMENTETSTATDQLNSTMTPNTTASSSEMSINEAVSMLNQMNGNFITSENKTSVASDVNTFLIEIEGDQINITTTTASECTTAGGDSETTPVYTSDSSQYQIQAPSAHESINSRSDRRNDSNNNNNDNDSSNNEYMACNQSDDYNKNDSIIESKNNNIKTTTSTAADATNNNYSDQNTIDSFISQILVDSLNNIIVVEGKVCEPSFEDSNNQSENHTQTDNTPVAGDYYIDENISMVSLPLTLNEQKRTYFPHYSSPESLSEFSAKYSNETSAIDGLPANIMISIISGSSYPMDGGEMIVHRFTEMPRTESMEAQPSSGSLRDDDEITKMDCNASDCDNDDNDDDSVSLVDSLDDPIEKPIEKSKAFFVPIDDNGAKEETKLNCDEIENRLDLAVASAMPDKLRERLEKRQSEINHRKEIEIKRKQKKIQKIINEFENKEICNEKTSTSSSSDMANAQTAFVNRVEQKVAPKPIVIKKNNKFLRSEIGLLESYTVDAKGNLQFKEPQKAVKRKKPTASMPVVKHVALKKVAPARAVKVLKPRDFNATKSITIKRTINPATKSQAIEKKTRNRNKGMVTTNRNDVQQMTLHHQSPSDLITPDTDCGPRRMYQKTEIHDGEKRIEILEIVECLNSSPDSLPSRSSKEDKSSTKLSKIPIPVPPNRISRGKIIFSHNNHQRPLKVLLHDASNQTGSKNFATNFQHQINNNSKVDQIIADLLIEALNHSTDIGIEFVQTPQSFTPQTLHKVNGSKRTNLTARRTNGGGKRSAHSGGKYQQVFDAIPEEKSSLSVDSSNDELQACALTASSKESEKRSGSNSDTIDERPATQLSSGKAAIQSDQDKPEAWFGCFGRSHNDSPVDSILLDEEDQRKFASPKITKISSPNSIQNSSTTLSEVPTSPTITTTIPSQASRSQISSGDSENILPLLDETFETSVTGVRSMDLTSKRPYIKKQTHCLNPDHLLTHCAECEVIENELKINELTLTENIKNDNEIAKKKSPELKNSNNMAMDEVKQEDDGDKGHAQLIKPVARSNGNENVWQVGNIEKYDTFSKLNLSPITILSAREDENRLIKTLKPSIDNTSFIILHESENSTNFFPNITSTSNGNDTSTAGNTFVYSKHSNNANNHPCYDCCFCNPELHHRHNQNDSSPKTCNFCSSRHQTARQSTPTTFRNQRNHDTGCDTGRSSTAPPIERLYESKFRSNHTHISTRSRESDTVSMKCTKKTNRKIRKIVPVDGDLTNGNIEKTKKKEKEKMSESTANKQNNNKSKKKSAIPKLPPYHEWSSNSVDTSTSPTSSSISTGSSPRAGRRQDSKSVPNLPTADRWQNLSNIKNPMTKDRKNSRYQEFYGNETDEQRMAKVKPTTEAKSQQAPGWTVTLAGTYQDDMAPDVKMRLSFPKRSSSHNNQIDNTTSRLHRSVEHSKPSIAHTQYYDNGNYEFNENNMNDKQQAILPSAQQQLAPAESMNFNPKRTLSRNFYNSEMQQQQYPVRKYSVTNGNTNRTRDYSLPDVNPHRSNANCIIAKETAKKTIKRSEYSVAVASATRTISNFTNGKRAMSFQALNANTYQRIQNVNRNSHRDHSLELGHLSQRFSTPSPQPSSYYNYSPCLGTEQMALSILGNAIAPERKPPVPTMSERDLTRRHNSCFTRNRSVF